MRLKKFYKLSKMINNNFDFEKDTTTTAAATTSSAAHNSNTINSNDNSYFNRFDNRIAANLAAVLTGSRFRSSSCSKPKNSFGNSNANANLNANISNSTTNLNTTGNAAHNYNTLAASTRKATNSNANATSRHQPPTYLQLYNNRAASPMLSGTMGRRRPRQLFTQANLNCNDNEKVAQTPSSDEDNSPTELNNCKRLTDKPPLVKRLTMGLLRAHEESRPLVHANATTTTPTQSTIKQLNGSTTNQIYSNGYINDEAFEPEKVIASKFGDSCRQSLTSIPMLDNLNLNDNSEFQLKKRYLRETSSANSSPKIFANRMRLNSTVNHATRYNNTSNGFISSDADDEEVDLKDASWFQAGISRDIAVEVLSSKSPGAFLVRKSSSKPGCYALTLRVPSPPGPKIANYIILRTMRGYKIKGFRKEFSTLKALITHHSVMPELLPVPLAMPRPTNMTSSRRNLDDFDTYDSLQMLLKYLRAKNLENE